MNLFLAHENSLAMLRYARRCEEVALLPADHVRLSRDGPAVTGSALAGIHLPILGTPTPRNPLCLRLAGDKRAWRSHLLRISPDLETLPEKSYLEVLPLTHARSHATENELRIFVEAPALALVSAASALYERVADGRIGDKAALVRLIALAMEFAGSYARDPEHPATGEPVYELQPIVSVAEIATGLDQLCGRRGIELARRAANYVNDGSGSPMETLWYLLFCLPPRLGGLHLERPQQNVALEIAEELRPIACHRRLRPDFHWPRYQSVCEYDSRLHQSEGAFYEDRRRAKDYGLLGLSYFPITDRDTASGRAVKAFLAQFVKRLEDIEGPAFARRMRRTLSNPEVDAAREMLRATLMPPVQRWEDV